MYLSMLLIKMKFPKIVTLLIVKPIVNVIRKYCFNKFNNLYRLSKFYCIDYPNFTPNKF